MIGWLLKLLGLQTPADSVKEHKELQAATLKDLQCANKLSKSNSSVLKAIDDLEEQINNGFKDRIERTTRLAREHKPSDPALPPHPA